MRAFDKPLQLRAEACFNPVNGERGHRGFAEAEANGGLRWFNQTYREWRLAAKAEGRSMTYAEARARLRRHMFREVYASEYVAVSKSIFPPLRTLNLD